MSDISGTTVLIAEDDPLYAAASSMLLQKRGFTVIHARSGEDAVKAFLAHHVDIVLMDINLGTGIDGPRAAADILTIRDTPVVFISAFDDEDVISRTELVYSYGFVSKKSSEAVLISTIKSALRLFSSHQQISKGLRDAESLTERKHECDKLKESEERYKSIFENNHSVMYILDPADGRIIDANPAAEKFYGWPREKLKTMKISEINTLPIDKIKEAMAKVFREKKLFFEFKHRLANGDVRDVAIYSGKIFFDNSESLFSIVHDITESKTAQAKLIESEKNLKQAQKIAKIGNWQWRAGSSSAEWSEEMYRIFDLDRDTVSAELNKVSVSRIHPADRESVIEKSTSFAYGSTPFPFEYRIVHRDGSIHTVWSETGELGFGENGEPLLLSGIVIDITDRKHIEEALSASVQDKEALLRELQHRVKNSLAMICSLISIDAMHSGNVDTKNSLGKLRDQITSLSKLYDLLYLTGNVRSVNLHNYFSAIIDSISTSYLTVPGRIDIRYNAPDIIVSSKQAAPLGLILNELLTNALKHAFPGETAGYIAIELSIENGNLLFSINDNGRGINENFDIKSSSHGLGMQLLSLLTEQMNGSVRVIRNTESWGFLIELPMSILVSSQQ